MSTKRRKRNSTEAKHAVYAPGAAVPRDVTHLLVPSSVEALPDHAFQRLERLEEVVLSEGLRRIGRMAFNHCTALKHITFPSSLVRTGKLAFNGCKSLTTLQLPEGLIDIDSGAFEECSSLTHVSFSSTVTKIDDWAFHRCSSLKVVTLVEGIRTIGHAAFHSCALEGIILPTTLAAISRYAFAFCRFLKTVRLCGGIQLIEGDAFTDCYLLDCIRTAPECLLLTNYSGNYDFNYVTDGSIPVEDLPRADLEWAAVIASECFYSISPDETSALETAITEILEMDLEWDTVDIRERLRRALVPHERRHRKEVTSLLELGLWKAEMQRSGGTGPGAREECRVTCKAGDVIRNVVPFL